MINLLGAYGSTGEGGYEGTGDGGSIPEISQTTKGITDYSLSLRVSDDVEESHFICSTRFELPLDAPKLLLLGIAENAAASVTTRENAGILSVTLLADIALKLAVSFCYLMYLQNALSSTLLASNEEMEKICANSHIFLTGLE